MTAPNAQTSVPARGKRKAALGDRALNRVRRIAKFARRMSANAMNGGVPETHPVFIMGCQRRDPCAAVRARAGAGRADLRRRRAVVHYNRLMLRPDDLLEQRFARCVFPWLVLKPLCESHRARQLLERFPTSRIIWIFRGYPRNH